MAQVHIPSCSSKDKEIQIAQVNGEGQTQSDGAAKSWLNQVKKTFNPTRKMWQMSRKVCIYRVFKCIRICKPEAYAPFVISFGPYHHQKNPELSIMDQYKLEAVYRMLPRLKINMISLIAEIQKLESEIRECYAEPIELDGETLSWMLAMDACFILEFFNSFRREIDTDCFSLVFQTNNSNSMRLDIANDIIKLENQIPLFILITLLELQFRSRESATTELAAILRKSKLFDESPFSSSLSDEDAETKLKEHIQKNPPPCHLLDLHRIVIKDLLTHSTLESATAVECYDRAGGDNINSDRRQCGWWRKRGWMQRLSCTDILSSSPNDSSSTLIPESPDDSRSTPCAQSLQGAGIKFQPGKIGFVKKRFGSSTLYLPQIFVDDDTETKLRNLMAYEECQRCSWPREEIVISQYVYLFDDLIDSEKDVSILKKSQVIRSLAHSDEDIAHVFNHIMQGIIFCPNEEIEAVMRKARKHYNSKWSQWMSQFKEEYCSKPWYVVSLVAAILILGMTAVQTVYSVKK